MKRFKKYNDLKYSGINYLLDPYTEDSLYDCDIENLDINDYKEYISTKVIKNICNFSMEKELLLDTYILRLNNIIVIHVDSKFINDFEFLYKHSDEYVFEIYQSKTPRVLDNSYNTTYHIFCISKRIPQDFDFILFLRMNDSIEQYTCLSYMLGPLVILNRRFDILSSHDKYNAKYKYIKRIGKGTIDVKLQHDVNIIVKLINTYQDILPPHYIKFN
jgi:hypothetical protein